MNSISRIAMTVVCTLCSIATEIIAQEATPPLRVIHWDEMQAGNKLPSGEIIPVDGPYANVLEIKHEGPGPAEIQLAEIIDPGITESMYAISGQIRYEGVAGTAYLEMLNYLPDGQWFFSRTLAEVGPLESITGTSGWRDFRLPASLGEDPHTPKPNRLVVNLHLSGPGTVYLSDLRLANASAEWQRGNGGWWGPSMGGIVGGVVGTLLGLIGAVVGTLCGIGRGRLLAVSLLVVMAAGGAVCLVTGIVAVVLGQPYAVYYPLLLIGLIASVLGCVGIPISRQRFAQAELRRMQALDVG